MIFYQRKLYAKLIILRCISFAAGILCFLSFKEGYTNLGYFLAVVLVFLSIISIEDLIVYPDHFEIKRIYLFGILPVKWTFHKKDNIVLHTQGSQFNGEDGEGFSHVETPVGCLFYLYTIFFGTKNRVTHRKFIINKPNARRFFKNNIELFLSKEEYELLKDLSLHKSNSDLELPIQ